MAMKDGAGTPLNPANLWGKPDPRAGSTKEQKVSRRIDDEEQFEDEDVDLDAELDAAEEEGPLDDEVADDDEDEIVDEENDGDFEPEEGDAADETEENEEYDVEEEVVAESEDADAELETDADEQAESVDDEAEVDDDTYATDEVDTAPVATNRKRDMAEKKTSLSDHIRAEIARRKTSGASLRGKDIVEALAARKIKVSPAQVSQIMKKEGIPPGKPGRRKAAVEAEGRSRDALQRKRQPTLSAKPAAKPVSKAPERAAGKLPRVETSRGFNLPMAQLKAVEAFVEACGGFQNAERILTAAASLSNQFSAFED